MLHHSNHGLFNSRLETDSFVLFFFTVYFPLKYADSSNQRDFFLLRSFALGICPDKSVEYVWPQKNFATRATFFSLIFFFSSRVCFIVYQIKSLCSNERKYSVRILIFDKESKWMIVSNQIIT